MELMDKVMTATEAYLIGKGYGIIERFEDVFLADDDGTMAIIKVVVVEGEYREEISREDAEAIMVKMLNSVEQVISVPVRFDEIQVLLMNGSRALIRHHVNSLED